MLYAELHCEDDGMFLYKPDLQVALVCEADNIKELFVAGLL